MGNLIETKKSWEDVVKEKRLVREKALGRFIQEDQTVAPQLKADQVTTHRSESIKGTEIVDRLARHEVSCEELVKSYIQKLVIFCVQYPTYPRVILTGLYFVLKANIEYRTCVIHNLVSSPVYMSLCLIATRPRFLLPYA